MLAQLLRFSRRPSAIVILLALVPWMSLCAEEGVDQEREITSLWQKTDPLIDFKVGYFFFSSESLRKVYKSGGYDLQLSASYPVWKGLHVYGSLEFLSLSGNSLSEQEKTSLWQIPLSVGIKPIITICKQVQYYVTLGPRYFFLHQHNSSSYVPENISRSGLGGFVNTGFNFFPNKHLFFDLFGEFSYKRMHFPSSSGPVYGTTAQIGGFTLGAGAGYSF